MYLKWSDKDFAGKEIYLYQIWAKVDLEQGGQVIDDNGTWLVDLPMNLDYITTNEFGERIISNDPNVGIPTKAKYRFKIKWNQSPKLSEPIKRGYFLVPNIKEYGWTSLSTQPTYNTLKKTYSFSLFAVISCFSLHTRSPSS